MPASRRRAADTNTSPAGLVRKVGAEIEVEVTEPTTLDFQIAVSRQSGVTLDESLAITLNGKVIEPSEIVGEHQTRIHVVQAGRGTVTASYSATVIGQADVPPVSDIDLITYLRPSRYAESDKFFGFATTEFEQYASSVTLLEKVSSWVGTRLRYVPGSSDPIDGAADTLLAGEGVCRDYAHLVIALLRALYVRPAWWRCTRRAASQWIFTRSPRHSSTVPGGPSMRRASRHASRWCGSPPDAMPPTPRSWTTTRAPSHCRT